MKSDLDIFEANLDAKYNEMKAAIQTIRGGLSQFGVTLTNSATSAASIAPPVFHPPEKAVNSQGVPLIDRVRNVIKTLSDDFLQQAIKDALPDLEIIQIASVLNTLKKRGEITAIRKGSFKVPALFRKVPPLEFK